MATAQNGPEIPDKPDYEERKLKADHLGRLIEIYKQHFDLYVKGVAGYLVVLGFIGGIVTKPETVREDRIALSLLVSLASVFGIIGSVISLRWVRTMKEKLQRLSAFLDLEDPLLSSAGHLVTSMIGLCLVLLAGGVAYAIALWKGVMP
jgi:hypothetical protein